MTTDTLPTGPGAAIAAFPAGFDNPILDTDSYKLSHWLQYPPGLTALNSYIEARSDEHALGGPLVFGFQAFARQYLSRRVTRADIAEAADVLAPHGLPFNRAAWERVVDVHGGYLPLEISLVPEGTRLPIQQVCARVDSTDPQLAWLVGHVETALLRALWYPSTVAAVSASARRLIGEAMDRTAGHRQGLEFKLHDFGARGVSSLESAALGGLAHLVSFDGTDTLAAVLAARRWYAEPMAGFSIPAAEHATITSWGRAGEEDAYANMLRAFGKPGATLAVVSDSYDLFHAIDHLWGETLRGTIEGSGATLVVRPDSGTPAEIVPEALDRLGARFGHTLNSKGFRLLPPHVRVIQGDGVSIKSLPGILDAVERRGWSIENLAFGMGGGLLQQVHRDTLGWAMKVSAAEVDGAWRDVFKDPVTAGGAKRSKKGRLALVGGTGGRPFETVRFDDLAGRDDRLLPTWRNGELLVSETLAKIRARALT